MKVRYVGESFGIVQLTNGKVYECTEVDEVSGMLRIIDDEGPEENPGYLPGYLYSPINPRPLDGSGPGGKWEIVEDDEQGTLRKAIYR